MRSNVVASRAAQNVFSVTITGTPAASASRAAALECVTSNQVLRSCSPSGGWRRIRPIGLWRRTTGRPVAARTWRTIFAV